MKYILVTGGVISGIGKGVIASSLATLLKSCGQRVTAIKIDPYLNVDAGTFSPYEHGEVFVLDDGGEVDLGLGNYERFLDITLHSENNITTGKVYLHVITKERRGDYLGQTVQVVPHITDAIQEFIESVAKKPVSSDESEPEICIIELGGTIGDIEGMPFVEAFRQFQFRVKLENFCCVHVSLVPEPKATGEQKTKPTQSSVRELRGLGLSPDVIVCRSENELGDCVKEKISNFCHVAKEHVICIHDCATNYHVPLMLEDQNVIELLTEKLKLDIALPISENALRCWKDLAEKYDTLVHDIPIALVGQYTQLEDAYASVIKALNHASLHVGYRLNLKYIEASNLEPNMKDVNAVKYHEAWQLLCSSKGLIVPGGFGYRGIDGKLSAIQWARENKMPFLGVCLGLQCAVIEFARHVLGWKEANSQEWATDTPTPVVIKMPVRNVNVSVNKSSTMRLGKQQTRFKGDNSVLRQLYGGVDCVEERHRHGYEVNPKMVDDFETAGMLFVGRDFDNVRMEMMELDDHPYFVAVQYHPEYISRPCKPSPPYLGLILAACGKLQSYLAKDCQLTFENLSDDEEYLDNDLTIIQSPTAIVSTGKK